jgi:hypothetical protein
MDWILDLLTPLGITNNYSATADIHTSQFTAAFSSLLCFEQPFSGNDF